MKKVMLISFGLMMAIGLAGCGDGNGKVNPEEIQSKFDKIEKSIKKNSDKPAVIEVKEPKDSNTKDTTSNSKLVGTWEMVHLEYESEDTSAMTIVSGEGSDYDAHITYNDDFTFVQNLNYNLTSKIYANGNLVNEQTHPVSSKKQTGTWSLSGNQLGGEFNDSSNGEISTATITFSNADNTMTLERTDTASGQAINAITRFNRQ